MSGLGIRGGWWVDWIWVVGGGLTGFGPPDIFPSGIALVLPSFLFFCCVGRVVFCTWCFVCGGDLFPESRRGGLGTTENMPFFGGSFAPRIDSMDEFVPWVFRRLRIDSRGLFVCFLESGGCSRNFERGSGNGGKGPLFLSAFPFLQRMSEILRDKHATFWGVFGGLESILGSNRDFRVGRFHKIDFRGLFACFYFFVLTNTDFVVQYLCLD